MEAYQLHISLVGIKPLIWRRILLPSDIVLPDLHKIIQTTMGWTNSHLHQFFHDDMYYVPEEDDFGSDNIGYEGLKLDELLENKKDTLLYEYDFGDGWEHKIMLEEIKPVDINLHNPVCIDGEKACPPEDCGGPGAYVQFLKAINEPGTRQHKETMEWLGYDFDPDYFDKNEINEWLKSENYGCNDIY